MEGGGVDTRAIYQLGAIASWRAGYERPIGMPKPRTLVCTASFHREIAMDFLAAFHPQITHTPIVLIIVSLVFDLLGRALDREWWRKAAFAMLVLGVLGAGTAVLSGLPAGETAEHHGVPEHAVDEHQDVGILTLWLGIATVVARLAATRLKSVRGALAGLALVLHVATAVAVGVAAHRGGALVFAHGAAVRVKGVAVSEQSGVQDSDPDEEHH
jgi:uncharacterized membrane protein